VGHVFVGTSGFVYAHWRGIFYPRDLPARLWLERYVREFSTVELNSTFYRLPKTDAVDRWRDETPPGFVFAAKGSRFITHMKRLLDPVTGLTRYFEPVGRLGHKLAAVLWQLPPRWGVNIDRLEAFLAVLPRGPRHAVEFRDERWYCEPVCDVLDRHRVAFCEHDLLPRSPPRLTGGFRYVRFHGRTGKYRGHYGAEALAPRARDFARWSRTGDVFVYFNNDVAGHAISDARDLLAMLPRSVRYEASRSAASAPAHAE
jgi:uncharacterized protein YecE (DUF72 family)